ncbi:DUF3047 domain-containing protein [Azospirillum sp. Sh1]|nr:DUF3047 domain-containing protein [Azospirillum sp. Sh1]
MLSLPPHVHSGDLAAEPLAPGALSAGFAALLAAPLPGLAAFDGFALAEADLPWAKQLPAAAAGQAVTFLLAGRWHVAREHDVWVEPGVAFHARIAGRGPLYNPMFNTGTLIAPHDGPVEIARAVSEWADEDGRLFTPVDSYVQGEGRIEGIALFWQGDPLMGLQALAARGDVGGLVAAEIARLQFAPSVPAGWRYYHQFGDGGIFSAHGDEICCHTHKNVGVLQRDVSLPLEAGATIDWRWIVEELPADVPEDQALTHDYLSIAVEFDDGRDITYMWSAGLPVGTVFPCPLPFWTAIETHMVARSGVAELGRWLPESRNLFEDYKAHIGGNATRITRVWMIANSVFLRGSGSCRYAGIRIRGNGWHETLL